MAQTNARFGFLARIGTKTKLFRTKCDFLLDLGTFVDKYREIGRFEMYLVAVVIEISVLAFGLGLIGSIFVREYARILSVLMGDGAAEIRNSFSPQHASRAANDDLALGMRLAA